MPASVGSQAKLGFGTTSTVNKPLEFLRESLRAEKQILDTAGLRGTRSHLAERTRAGLCAVRGAIDCAPSPSELNDLLPFILGGAAQVNTPAGATTFPLAETLPAALYFSIDRVAKVFTYDLCKIVRATFRASEGELLTLSLWIEGGSETVSAAGTFPSLTFASDAPFVFMDASITLQGATRAVKELELVIENVGQLDRYLNSTTRGEIPIVDRLVTLRCTTPYTASETALHDQPVAGAAASLLFSNGNYSLKFDVPGALQVSARSPVVDSRAEIVLALNGVARRSAGNPELSVILDLTP